MDLTKFKTLADLGLDPETASKLLNMPFTANTAMKKTLARENLLDFIRYTKPDYITNWHHVLICKSIQDFILDPERDRLMVFVGPRRGKSEIISRRLPAWVFGHFPNMEIMATSYAADLAQAMSRDVQRIIDEDRYRQLFPKTQLSSKNVKTTSQYTYVRTADKFEIVNHKGVYKCAGVGGALTGMGADLLIVDDPLKDMQEAMSVKRKEVVYDWFQSVANTRLSANGKVIIVLTRWAEDDLAGRLLKDAEADPESHQWEVISLPEMYEQGHKYLHEADPRESDGEVLWPVRFPQKKMDKMKRSMPAKVWNSLFQQEPSPGEGVIFDPGWFRYYKEMPTDFEYKMASWDCTFKDATNSDFVVGTVWGIKGVHKYLLWMVRKRMSFVDTIQEMLIVNRRFPDLRYTLVEDKANGPAVISTLKNKIKGLIPFEPKGSKESRASSVSPQIQAGDVYLPDKYSEEVRRECPWITEYLDIFIEEFRAFPYGPNDDCVDSLVQALIKIGGGNSWIDELLKDDGVEVSTETSELDQHTRARNDRVAQIMGWDVAEDEVEDYGSGFSFDLNF